ncbi:quinone oxidoreductase family protein [Streptomyces acidiscabies]|uniref:Zinc-binding dehydrogenase n=5 Tax=Streptomyces acidiscabies TaxID=42234 RepID=A0AAP6EH84_9ACTN|nr:zinc-binding dehydrogenase [Streptomyces acidiscabies]MBP5941753.1 zinc-binding dehydrogenase [Streptomyces sp. LBUM 1476]MBZ3913172.1 zinc-binding dehydrogenase [Streptomyces acidiscabies]MDX2962867.1 zinc-binding dehydrogenase [Streptomyces acidiscabies]MDX3021378.1 zinc-binding dehydrogenase [Streptomyces acidiscabies]MDX3790136.1 zinc-binding dehydrogenase [Streptomyces acidiscabies]
MRAIEFHETGAPEVLKLVDAETPEPAPGQVTIDVAYAGVNFADVKARAEGYRVETLPFRPGLEVSGRIRTVGEGVTGLTPGQEVAAFLPGGGYAEVVRAEATATVPLPEGLDLRTAATLPTVLPTAHALLHEVGRLRTGETVLVHGAAGGVGTVVGLLARAAGAGAVYGVASTPAKAEYALKHGYDEVFTPDAFAADVRRATGGKGVDLILDPVGGETLRLGLDALALYGRLVSYGNASGAAPWQAGAPELGAQGRSVSAFTLLGLAQSAPDELRALTERAYAKVLDGTVSLPVTAEFPLTEAAEAHRLLGGRTSTGKLLLRVAD